MAIPRSIGFKDYITVGTSISKTDLEEKHGIGYIKRNALSQTDLSDIYDLKEAEALTQQLLGEVAYLRQDLADCADAMKRRYNKRVEDTASKLVTTLIEREEEIKRIHRGKDESLKHTFRQELADAIVKLSVDFEKNIDFNISKVRAKDTTEKTQKYKLLKDAVHRDECIIHALKTQLKRLHERFLIDSSSESNELLSEALKPSESDGNIEQEVEMLREKIPYMRRRVNNLQENLEDQMQHTTRLKKKTDGLKDKLHIHQEMSRLLKEEQTEIKDILDIKTASVQMALNKKRVEWEAVIEEKIEVAKQEVIEKARQSGLDVQMSAKEQERILMDEIHLLNEKIVKQIERRKNRSKEETDIELIILNNHRRMQEIERLRLDLVRVKELWENRFVVLQYSKEEIKEEMFEHKKRRRPLAQLNTASVWYSGHSLKGVTRPQQPYLSKIDLVLPSPQKPISARVSVFSDSANQLNALDLKFDKNWCREECSNRKDMKGSKRRSRRYKERTEKTKSGATEVLSVSTPNLSNEEKKDT